MLGHHITGIVAKAVVMAALLIGVLLALPGCYYMQAARGQLEVMRQSEPIDVVISANETPTELIERLRLVTEARQFSVDVLGLPDNDSYRSYADLERDYVVWNVVAAPEFSFQAKRWCYPIVGCVSYRGYFKKRSALRKVARLQEDGYDVAFGGVAAYSTLGKFNDPILNTMLHWEDVDLVAVIFHELAHQQLYIKDDSAFNESFASAIEQFGVERWLATRDNATQLDKYNDRISRRYEMMQHIDKARADLQLIYQDATDAESKRKLKAERFKRLEDDLRADFSRDGKSVPVWIDQGLNNARIASMALYNDHVPAFRALIDLCDNELACFFRRAEGISKLTKDGREQRLAQLADIGKQF